MTAEFLSFAREIAEEAGARLEEGHGTIARGDVEYKGWRNLVTEIDLAVEQRVAERIEARFPAHGILGEEGVAKSGTSDLRWVIDPLDGTTNYVHQHPFYCVSIGLEDSEGPLVGVVYAPKLREFFSSSRGGGAERNGTAIHVSTEPDIGRSLLASGFAYGLGTSGDRNLANWSRVSEVSRGLRRCGSAALDLCYVADGRYDGFWELGLNPWDVSAGILLVQEAGGRVTDCSGGDSYLSGESIASSNGKIHDKLLSLIEE